MRISQLEFKLTTADLNELIYEFAPDVKIRITDIQEDGLHGQLKLLVWNVDFVARPSCDREKEELSLDISARKLINIPVQIVEHQLREAMKDAPQGIEVMRQTLKVHVPSILQPLGISLRIREFRCLNGVVTVAIEQVRVPDLKRLLGKSSEATLDAGRFR